MIARVENRNNFKLQHFLNHWPKFKKKFKEMFQIISPLPKLHKKSASMKNIVASSEKRVFFKHYLLINQDSDPGPHNPQVGIVNPIKSDL